MAYLAQTPKESHPLVPKTAPAKTLRRVIVVMLTDAAGVTVTVEIPKTAAPLAPASPVAEVRAAVDGDAVLDTWEEAATANQIAKKYWETSLCEKGLHMA
mmetsp:Transcript_50702/g.135142  ORF Transcript_50702/g.135142 Transcript_50702/m.135142 type:complete len:100 (+) Transcript_50702:659-958(+)